VNAEHSSKYGSGSFIVHDDDDTVAMLSFREVQALAACRLGLARVKRRGTYSPWLSYERLAPECEVFGVGELTLSSLQAHNPPWQRQMVARPEAEGPLPLTPLGDEVLDAILALPGVQLHGLEAAAA
jgi:hypothetical protein